MVVGIVLLKEENTIDQTYTLFLSFNTLRPKCHVYRNLYTLKMFHCAIYEYCLLKYTRFLNEYK